MEVWSVVGAVLSGIALLQRLIPQKKVSQSNKDELILKMEPLLSEATFCKDIDDSFITFSRDLDRFSKEIARSRIPSIIEPFWESTIQSYKSHIEINIKPILERKRKVSLYTLTEEELENIPMRCREAADRIAERYPELIKELDEFIKLMNKVNEAILGSDTEIPGSVTKQIANLIKRQVEIELKANNLIKNILIIVSTAHSEIVRSMGK